MGDTFRELEFFQESFPSGEEAGQDLLEFNQEEILHVDWAQRQNVWRLPEFTNYTYQTQSVLGYLAVLKENLEILMKRTNQTQAQNGTWWRVSEGLGSAPPANGILLGMFSMPSGKEGLISREGGGSPCRTDSLGHSPGPLYFF